MTSNLKWEGTSLSPDLQRSRLQSPPKNSVRRWVVCPFGEGTLLSGTILNRTLHSMWIANEGRGMQISRGITQVRPGPPTIHEGF